MYAVKQGNLYYRNLIINSSLKKEKKKLSEGCQDLK